MEENEILNEVYAIKDQISEEMNADPKKWRRDMKRLESKLRKQGFKFVKIGKSGRFKIEKS